MMRLRKIRVYCWRTWKYQAGIKLLHETCICAVNSTLHLHALKKVDVPRRVDSRGTAIALTASFRGVQLMMFSVRDHSQCALPTLFCDRRTHFVQPLFPPQMTTSRTCQVARVLS